jgi:DNA polymerase III psi subunit
MYIEKNKTALQQLFAGEDIYLLKNEFVVVGEDSPPLSVSPQTTPSYYQPKQKVIILLNSLNPADSELLGKILGAVKLDLQSVDIVDFDKNQDVDLSQAFTQKSINQVITFGINLSKVSLDVKLSPYQILENQGIKFIYSDSLTDIQNDVPKKKALWGSLKEMFV